ncbi:unnamed protein product [Rotaria magnacalcarata]|uniref:YCII-related domain-containing protein n=1 Tax=Rotaria magnacalcarata TaxID=392030 RepID=A0A815ECP9_9BILA|nr:unnamed protein product [Rotaria magnacalcarata]CAF2211301.1 unnamed protein product [Rotaria magnacalcarata]CAF3770892.1 unnamed protein product [Rotaria magnacalcarata]CAF5156500.1 unnamed protein product [Rotaria magnacalcarata]
MASTSSTGAIQPKLHILQYEYIADVMEKRKPYREAHLAFIGKQVEKGNVILGGAYGSPPTGALLIFRNLSSNEIEQLAKQDPYVLNGIVTKHSVEPYIAVAGDSLLSNDLIKI